MTYTNPFHIKGLPLLVAVRKIRQSWDRSKVLLHPSLISHFNTVITGNEINLFQLPPT